MAVVCRLLARGTLGEQSKLTHVKWVGTVSKSDHLMSVNIFIRRQLEGPVRQMPTC